MDIYGCIDSDNQRIQVSSSPVYLNVFKGACFKVWAEGNQRAEIRIKIPS